MRVNPFFANFHAYELDHIKQIESQEKPVFFFPKRQYASVKCKKRVPWLPKDFYDCMEWSSGQPFGMEDTKVDLRMRWESGLLYVLSYYPEVHARLQPFGSFYAGFGRAYIINHALHAIELAAAIESSMAEAPEALTPYKEKMSFYATRRARMADLRVAIREHRTERDKELFEVKAKWERKLIDMKTELAAIESSSLQESVANKT